MAMVMIFKIKMKQCVKNKTNLEKIY